MRSVENFKCLKKTEYWKESGQTSRIFGIRNVSCLSQTPINPVPSSLIQGQAVPLSVYKLRIPYIINHKKTMHSDCSKCANRRTVLIKLMTTNKKLQSQKVMKIMKMKKMKKKSNSVIILHLQDSNSL